MAAEDKPTILIVEDDAGIAALEATRLEEAGYRTLTASTAAEAFRQLSKVRVELILLDYRLPEGVNGLDFHAGVKAAGYDIPVILVTGHSNEATVIHALRNGVRDFLTKSVEYLDYLPEAVDRVLRQVRTEQMLAESQARLVSVIATAKDAIIVVVQGRGITMFNAAAEQMFRCPAAEAIGQPLGRFIPPEMGPAAGEQTSMTTRLRAGTRGLRADGEEFPLEASVARGEASGQKFHTVVVRDITERKRVEDARRRSEALFRLVWENSVDAIRLTDQHGTVVMVNEAFCRLVQMERIDLEGKPFTVIHAPDQRDRLLEQHRERCAARSFPDRLERQVILWNGSVVWFDLANSYLEMPGHAPLLLTIVRDVTERRAAEERVREQAELLDQAQDAILVRDMKDRILFWSRGAERLYGWTAAEVQGRIAHELLYKSPTSESELALAHQAIIEEGGWSGELRQVAKDGREVVVQSRRTLLRDADGRPRAQLIINTDVTERKRLEAQLQHAQRLEAVGLLASGIAHDFNNLLTIISGYTELLLTQSDANDPARDLLWEIHKAGERAAGLTRQLLAFSRKSVLAPQALDLNALVAETEKLLRRLLGADIDLATALAPTVGRVRADPGQLEHVIINLAVNARDAMPGGGMLTLETRNVEMDEEYARTHVEVQPGPYVLLAVSDTGVGMDEATRARIFEPFFTTKAVGKGTGLGLPMVHGIVKQSGGHIEVYSEPGRGTTFKIYLPRIAAPADVASRETPARLPGGSETILLAEDEDSVRKLARIVLESAGYTILEAASGDEGLRIAEAHPGRIDLLLTDVVMPRISGRELGEQMAAVRPGLKLLYMSGYTDDAIVRHGLVHAGTAFLQKPFPPAALVRKVREVLDQPG